MVEIKRIKQVFSLISIFFVLLALRISTASASPACGSTITANTVLDADMSCTGTAIIIGADNIVLDCAGHSITGINGNGIDLSGRTGVTIKNCVVTKFNYGISFRSSSYNTLTGNIVSNTLNGGISIYANSNNNIIANNTVSNINGIALGQSSNNTFANNTISTIIGQKQWGLFIQGSSLAHFQNNIAIDNTIDGLPINYYDGFYRACPDNQNLDLGSNWSWFGLAGCTNVTVTATNILDHVLLAYTTNSRITGINVLDSQLGIFLYNSSNNIIANNTATNNRFNGIYLLSSSNNNTITNNTASLNSIGISVYSSYNNNIINNNVHSNSYSGIYIGSSFDNSIISNTANNNAYYGISIDYYSSNNIIANNTATNNKNGIGISSNSNNNTLTGNTANSNGQYGIYLEGSSDNQIYNNLFNNTNNVEFGGTIGLNYWNTTKIAGTNIVGGSYFGGNFWANPSGAGYSEMCTDADRNGICDSAYTLNTNNIDYLPLKAGVSVEPVCGNGILESGEQCDEGAEDLGNNKCIDNQIGKKCDPATCQIQNVSSIVETCNNKDNDCDGSIDEDLTQVCGSGDCAGIQTCNSGVWSDCSSKDTDCGICALCDAQGNCNVYDETQDDECPATQCPDSCTIDSNPFDWDCADDIANECKAKGECTQKQCSYAHQCRDNDINDGVNDNTCEAECDQDTDCAATECDFLNKCYDGTYRVYSDVPNTCQDSCACTSNACVTYATKVTDNDNDGYDIECDNDCNDNNAAINPRAFEIPGNNIDENCDNIILCNPEDEWKNHGQFVSCVAKEAEKLLEQELITEEEKDEIVSNAAKSDVGKKKK